MQGYERTSNLISYRKESWIYKQHCLDNKSVSILSHKPGSNMKCSKTYTNESVSADINNTFYPE